MNNQQRKMHYRITYRKSDGSRGAYFIAEENAEFAIIDFKLRTGNARESVICVDVQQGKDWVRAL